MRIDGTDASSVSFNNSPDQRAAVREIPLITQKTNNDGNLQLPGEKADFPISEKKVTEAIDKVNKVLAETSRRFEVSVHEATHEIMVKVIDSNTNEVIREIPPKKILDLVAKMMEMAGLIVDERR